MMLVARKKAWMAALPSNHDFTGTTFYGIGDPRHIDPHNDSTFISTNNCVDLDVTHP